MKELISLLSVFVFLAGLVVVGNVYAVTDCTFTTVGSTMSLDGDCTTDTTILIPDGMTLDGNGHTITAVDPAGDHFRGAVVANDGATAHVENLTVTTSGLANVCDAGDDRLRGIMFEGASGSIMHSDVLNINQGASGCQEGNAIEVRNAPFDGTHPNTQTVEVAHNGIYDYQKTGIVCNGDVNCNIHHNKVGDSATQANLAANSIQLGFGATGDVMFNQIDGNQWLGASCFVATAVLIFDANGVNASNNQIRGNSEIGMYIFGDNGTYNNNTVFDEGADSAVHTCGTFDIGIGNWGTDNTIQTNVVRGFDEPYDGVLGGRNITVPGSQPSSDAF